MQRSLDYMGLAAGTAMEDVVLDKVFLGSCTNGRIEDLRAAAKVVAGRKVASNVHAMVVPGSGLVRLQAEQEGLDKVFTEAGFEWREAGCSMCLGMNPDQLAPQERCASTSNRNFEGRQGRLGRTHLLSPEMAAAGCDHRQAHRRAQAGRLRPSGPRPGRSAWSLVFRRLVHPLSFDHRPCTFSSRRRLTKSEADSRSSG